MNDGLRQNIAFKTFAEITPTTQPENSGLLAIFQGGSTRQISFANLLQDYLTETQIQTLIMALESTVIDNFASTISITDVLDNRLDLIESNYTTLNSAQTFTGEKSFDADANINGSARLGFDDAGVRRWQVFRNTTTNDFNINRYNDSGNYQTTPIVISQGTGETTINTNLNTPDGITTSTIDIGSIELSEVSGELIAGGQNLTQTAVNTTALVTAAQNHPIRNILNYGAVGDDATDNLAAINAAIADCPEGGLVVIPIGVYRISAPIVIQKRITIIGSHSPRWSYRPSVGSEPCQLKPHSSFTGDAMVIINNAPGSDTLRLENFALNGNSKGTNVIGILVDGLVRDVELMRVSVSQTSGAGIETRKTGGVNPRGLKFFRTVVHSAGNTGFPKTGFLLDTPTDSSFDDCLAVACEGDGWQISNPGDTHLIGCRSVFNTGKGFRLTGNPTVGGIQLTSCSTDRNGQEGLRISQTGDQPVLITGFDARRDGSDGVTPGIVLAGTALDPCAPVKFANLTQSVGENDGGGGNISPVIGLQIEHATDVQISGSVWGVTSGYSLTGSIANPQLFSMKSLTGSIAAGVTERNWNTADSLVRLRAGLDLENGSELQFKSGGLRDWKLTSNNGGNLTVNRYDGSGNFADAPVSVNANSGSVTLSRDLFVNGSQAEFNTTIKSKVGLEIRSSAPPTAPLNGGTLYASGNEILIRKPDGGTLNLTQILESATPKFPVGYLLINTTGTNPATELGYGTWVAFGTGRTLVGRDTGDTRFDTAEETGGQAEVTLGINTLPVHNHDLSLNPHSHQILTASAGSDTTEPLSTAGSAVAGELNGPEVYLSTNGNGVSIIEQTTATGIVDNQGLGEAHNNLQPYIVVHFWKRTA
jgi:microcystin-dependent protein